MVGADNWRLHGKRLGEWSVPPLFGKFRDLSKPGKIPRTGPPETLKISGTVFGHVRFIGDQCAGSLLPTGRRIIPLRTRPSPPMASAPAQIPSAAFSLHQWTLFQRLWRASGVFGQFLSVPDLKFTRAPPGKTFFPQMHQRLVGMHKGKAKRVSQILLAKRKWDHPCLFQRPCRTPGKTP